MSSRIDVIRNRWVAPSDHTKPNIRVYADRDWQIKAALEDIPFLLDENERLREGLRRLEWTDNAGSWGIYCVVCHGGKPESDHLNATGGHKPDCWLAKLLEGK